MPMIPETEPVGIRPIGLPEGFEVTPDLDAPVERPGLLETFGAGFRQENVAVNAVNGLLDSSIGEPDPEHNPWPLIEGTEFEPHADSFLSSVNEADTRRRMERIRRENADRKMLADAGAWGVAAGVAGSIIDLPSLIPGVGIIRGVRAGQVALKTAGTAAALGGLAATSAEMALQGTQETRTAEESALNIGGSVLLSGLLGGAVGAATARSASREFQRMARMLDTEMAVPERSVDDLYGEGGVKDAQDLSAAVVNEDVKLKGALGFEKAVRWQDPLLRNITSQNKATRTATARLAEVPMTLEGDVISPGGAVETIVKGKQASRLYNFINEMDQAYSDYRFGAPDAWFSRLRGEMTSRRSGYLTYSQFKEEVGKAARRGDKHEIPQVAKAAKAWRQHVAEPGKVEAIEAKLLPEDVEPQTAESYLSRLYRKELIAARRPDFENVLVEWMGKRQVEARNKIRELEDAIAGAKAGDEAAARQAAVDRAAIAELQEEAAFSRMEVESIATQVTDLIMHGQDGRVLYRLPKSARGPLKERTLLIPDLFESSTGTRFEDFLESDAEIVARAYNRTIIPDVEITRAFGDLEMTDAVQKIRDEAAQRSKAAKSEKERRKIDTQATREIRDLKAMADRIRGTYALPNDPNAFVRAGRLIRALNYMRLLGGMTVSAIPDVARVVMVHGVTRTFNDAFVPLVTNFRQFRLANQEVKLAGAALDMVLDSRTMALADIMDDYGRASKFERFVQGAQQRFGFVSLMAPWNAAMKQIAGTMSATRFLQSASKMKAGKALSRVDLEHLRDSRIDDVLARRIADQFDKHGEVDGGLWLANTDAWDDKVAANAFRNAILRDADRIIVTPGQDKPLVASTEIGKMFFQFKSFAISTVQRTMIAGLQQRDAAALNGVMLMMGLGTLSAWTKMKLSGQPLPEDPTTWAVEAFDRSGLAGWLFEANNLSERVTRGNLGFSALTGREVSRYAGRDITNSLVGPTAGLIRELASVGSLIEGDMTESDIRALRRTVPLQNVFYLRWLLDQAEQGTIDALGVPQTRR